MKSMSWNQQDTDMPLNLPEYLLPVEQVGYEHPYRGGQEVLCQVLCVWLAIGHLPTKREIFLKHFMSHIHQDGIHTRVEERSSRPPLLYIHRVVKNPQSHKSKTAESRHIRKRPQVFVDRDEAFVSGALGQYSRDDPQYESPNEKSCDYLLVLVPVMQKNFPCLKTQKSHQYGVDASQNTLRVKGHHRLIYNPWWRCLVNVVISEQPAINVTCSSTSAVLVQAQVTNAPWTQITSWAVWHWEEEGQT